MPVELSDSLKNTFGMTFASRGMNNLFYSKIFTTLILTIMILILITIIYPCKKGTPFWIIGKLGLYIFLSCLAILFIHDGVVYSTYQNDISGGASDEFVRALDGRDNVAFGDDNVDIKPTFSRDMEVDGAEYNTNGSSNSNEIFDMFGV
jgi:hypothetical protein